MAHATISEASDSIASRTAPLRFQAASFGTTTRSRWLTCVFEPRLDSSTYSTPMTGMISNAHRRPGIRNSMPRKVIAATSLP